VTEIAESKFADDAAALYTVTRHAMTFVATAAGWGLTISLEKTKMMSMDYPEAGDNRPIQLENEAIAAVNNFTYLGSNIVKLSVKLVQGCKTEYSDAYGLLSLITRVLVWRLRGVYTMLFKIVAWIRDMGGEEL